MMVPSPSPPPHGKNCTHEPPKKWSEKLGAKTRHTSSNQWLGLLLSDKQNRVAGNGSTTYRARPATSNTTTAVPTEEQQRASAPYGAPVNYVILSIQGTADRSVFLQVITRCSVTLLCYSSPGLILVGPPSLRDLSRCWQSARTRTRRLTQKSQIKDNYFI